MKERVLVVGASPNPSRYAYMAVRLLLEKDYDVVPIGIKRGNVFGKQILDIRTEPKLDNIDTITLYIRAEWQEQWEQYLLRLRPKRIIFNPGAENPALEKRARESGVETLEACTLVMLGTNQF